MPIEEGRRILADKGKQLFSSEAKQEPHFRLPLFSRLSSPKFGGFSQGKKVCQCLLLANPQHSRATVFQAVQSQIWWRQPGQEGVPVLAACNRWHMFITYVKPESVVKQSCQDISFSQGKKVWQCWLLANP